MADVIAGKSSKDNLSVVEDKTQVYGLAGNDTLKSYDKNEVLLIGGSGNDVLQMTGGTGTLVGGKGNDTFELNYSATKKISAVIEDLNPTDDKILVKFDGSASPQLSSVTSGNDVIWSDGDGNFNLTLKGSSEASDYYDGAGNENIWDVLRLTNQERENQNLSPLTLSQNLTDGAAIRSEEIIETFSHTRPNGESCFTAVKNIYWSMGENIAAGQASPEEVVTAWMNSPGHRANILNSGFKKLGGGYTYDASSTYQYNWVQMFGGSLVTPDTVSTADLLAAKITVSTGSLPEDTTGEINTVISSDNTNIRRGGVYTIAKNFSGTIRINTTDAVTIDGTSAGSLKNVQVITYADTADLTVKNLVVTNETGSVLTFGDGTGNKLTLTGKNVLKTSDTWAAVVNIGGGLTIDGTGSLDVTAGSQGSGIGLNSYQDGNANLTINGGTITATTDMGAGVGSGCSGSIGNISINGGSVTATSQWGEKIGAGYNGTAGKVTSTATTDPRKIIGTENADTINNTVVGATIQALGGNDSINNSGANVTIFGGTGNDSIWNSNAEKVVISGDDGSDTVDNLSANVSISGGNGNDYLINSGKNSTILGGNDRDTISNYAESVTINGGNGNNYINNGGNYVSISGGADRDTVSNAIGSYVTIDTGAGDDSISNTGKFVTVSSGLGNDFISNGADEVSISGGTGNDTIVNEYYSADVTISGGAGNDRISLGSNTQENLIQYTNGDGNDTIYGFNATSTLSISSGKYSTATSGNNVIVTVGTGKITLVGAKGTSLNIKGTLDGGGNSTLMTVTNSTKSPVTIDSAVKTVDASKRTTAVKITGNDAANSIVGGSKNDTLFGGKGNDTLTGGKGNDIFIYSAGNDVITDYAAGDKISLGAAISKSSIKGSDVVFTLGKNTLTVKNGKAKTLSLIDAAGKSSSTIIGGSTTSTLMTVTNSTKSPVTIDSAVKTVDASKRTTAVKITGNDAANSIVGGLKNDTLNGGKGNDTLTGGKGNDIFIYSAGNDVITDYASGDKISVGAAISKSSVKGSDVVFTVGKNTLTVKNGKAKTLSLIDTKGKSSSTIIGGGNSTLMTVTNSTKSPVTIGSSVKTVDASKRTTAVKITGNDAANSIVGGSKNDTLFGGKGNDTLTGGKGNDIFIYSAGNDVITDYATGDKISVGAAISKSTLKGSDVIFTIGKNTLTVKNGKAKTLTLIDTKGKSSTTILVGSTTSTLMTVTNSTKSPVTIGSAIKTVDASKRTTAVKITGNDAANSIVGGSKNDTLFGGKGNDTLTGNGGNDKLFGDAGSDKLFGGAGNDTLNGGAGNDSLWGDAGADTFLYSNGDGKDVIFGFDGSDMLEILDASFSGTYNKSKKEIAFKVGSTSNAITLRDFTATTFNVNGDTYKISGTKLIK